MMQFAMDGGVEWRVTEDPIVFQYAYTSDAILLWLEPGSHSVDLGYYDVFGDFGIGNGWKGVTWNLCESSAFPRGRCRDG
jgi:hypothetical protein